jgi:hypothetical protein
MTSFQDDVDGELLEILSAKTHGGNDECRLTNAEWGSGSICDLRL